jgi:outer membrane protein, heavy metal efflux system
MDHPRTHNLRVRSRLLPLCALLAYSVGCAGDHLHYYNQAVVVAPATAVPPSSSARLGSPTLVPTNAADSTNNSDPQVTTASYQAPALVQKTWPLKDNAGPLSVARNGEGPPVTKLATIGLTEISTTLTFDQVITATLLADPKIRAGLESINQANADLRTSSLFPNPTLVADGVLLPLQQWTPDRTGGPPQLDVQLAYPIDWFLFGKRAAAMASANLGVRQSEADYGDLIRQRVRDAAVAFFDVMEAKGLLDVARQDTDNLTKLETATKKAVDAGGRPIVELNRVRLDLLKSQQAQREAESAYAVAKAKLRAFMGRTDADPTFDVRGDLDAPLNGGPLPVEQAFALAQDNRPDIQSLRWQVSKAEADVVVEDKKAFPQVTPMFGYTRQFQGAALGMPDADSWDVTVTATLPVFDRNQGNRMKAQSVAAQNRLNLQAGTVDLRAEIEQVVQEFQTAHQNAIAIAQEQLKLAADVRDSITKAYEVGGRALIEVLDAQRNYRETYRLYISSRANYWRSLYQFSAAIGKQVMPHDELPH